MRVKHDLHNFMASDIYLAPTSVTICECYSDEWDMITAHGHSLSEEESLGNSPNERQQGEHYDKGKYSTC